MQVDSRHLSDFLFDAGLLSRGDLLRAQEMAGERDEPLAAVLVHAGILQDDDVRRALASLLGIPFIQLQKDALDTDVLILLPEAFSRAHNVVAFAQSGAGVELALLDMDDLDAARNLLPQGKKALPRLTNAESLKHALIHYQKHLKEKFGSLLSEEMARLGASHSAGDAASHDATVRATDALVRHALYNRASDMHLEPGVQGLRVRYRVGAELFDAMQLPPVSVTPILSRLKLLAQLPLTSDVPGVGRFKIALQGAEHVWVTVSSVPRVYADTSSEKLVVSFAPEQGGSRGLSFASLGVSQKHIHTLHRVLAQKTGLILVCGNEGAGKTTMLYTLLDELADRALHIASVEARVSYTLPGVSHMEINERVGLTSASSIRAQLRQDTDVLMVDCPLDEEVALLAVQAANRGVLVLLGVEARSAAEGIEQLLALDVPPQMLAGAFVASVGTGVVPKLCAESRSAHRLSRAEQTALEDTIDIKQVLDELRNEQVIQTHTPWKDLNLYAAAPCAQCEGGYAGLIGVQEILSTSLALKDLIRGEAGADALRAQAKSEGQGSYAEDALYKTVQGLLSVEEALQVAGA